MAWVAILVCAGFFLCAPGAQAAEDYTWSFDKINFVGQGKPEGLVIQGEIGGETKAVGVDLESTSTAEKDYMEYCKKAALLTLSNNNKYKLDVFTFGTIYADSAEVDLGTSDEYLFCALNLRY